MRLRLCVRAVATAGLALAGYTASPSMSFGVLGIDSAEAAQFYTRKRVNGAWVTGQFPKGAGSARAASSRRAIRHARKTIPRFTAVPASAELAKLTLPDLRREPGPSITGSTKVAAALPAASMPDIEAALVTAAIGPVAPAGMPAAEERGIELRRALERRADELAAKVETGIPGAPAAAPADPQPLSVQRSASVEAAPRVEPVAALPTVDPSPAAEAGKTGPLVPRSVSFDFETGIKTTVYESSVVREPFDVGTVRNLTARSLPIR